MNLLRSTQPCPRGSKNTKGPHKGALLLFWQPGPDLCCSHSLGTYSIDDIIGRRAALFQLIAQNQSIEIRLGQHEIRVGASEKPFIDYAFGVRRL